MIGQQQTVAGSTLLRRMVLALMIAAVMALLMIALAAPAFAASYKKANKGASTEVNQVAVQTTANNLNDIYYDEPGKGGWDVTAKYAKDHDNKGIDDIASQVRS